MHRSYGLGALVCPLAATAFASSGIRFSFFYALSIGLAALNVGILLVAFRFNYRIPEVRPAFVVEPVVGLGAIELQEMGPRRGELAEERRGAELEEKEKGDVGGGTEGVHSAATSRPESTLAALAPGQSPSQDRAKGILHETLTNRAVVIWSVVACCSRLALAVYARPFVCCSCVFILVYVGSEVSMGGKLPTLFSSAPLHRLTLEVRRRAPPRRMDRHIPDRQSRRRPLRRLHRHRQEAPSPFCQPILATHTRPLDP